MAACGYTSDQSSDSSDSDYVYSSYESTSSSDSDVPYQPSSDHSHIPSTFNRTGHEFPPQAEVSVPTIENDSEEDDDDKYCPRKLKRNFKNKQHGKQNDEDTKYSCIRLWHKGIVHYKYGSSIAQKDPRKTENITAKIKKAIEMFEDQTPIKWIEVSDTDSKKDFHEFELVSKGKGNSPIGLITQVTYYGYTGISQKIKVEEAWDCGNIMHEMCHTVGLIHEHQRSDRDKFVEITRSAITDEVYNKDYIIRNEALLSEYDLRSIMHYEEGKGIAIKKHVDTSIKCGQRVNFSIGDLKKIDRLYGLYQCTYDRFGAKPRLLRYYYTCVTCSKQNDRVICCYYCVYKCHKSIGHKTQ